MIRNHLPIKQLKVDSILLLPNFLFLSLQWILIAFTTMTTIIERTPNRVTVSMSTRRWNRMLQLEETYKLARIIKRSMKQVESESAMTPEETIAALRAL